MTQHHAKTCTTVRGAGSKTDPDACARADELIKQAFRVLVQGTRITHIVPVDCLRCRAQRVIMHFASLLHDQVEAYGLDAHIRIALNSVLHNRYQFLSGYIPEIFDDYVHKYWDDHLKDSKIQPWVPYPSDEAL
jgi:hypothetical protein